MAQPSGSGVIVGRFQVHALNAAHDRLFKKVWLKHKHLYVVLCSNPAPGIHNPLPWELRRLQFLQKYNDRITVLEMPDLPDDRIWSQELDRRILELRPPRPIVLYGTPDRFVSLYSGQFPAKPLEVPLAEAQEATEKLGGILSLEDFCAGMVYATARRYPTVYPTVDIALFSNDFRYVLLARKPNETGLRFPGGFADPQQDESFEDAALRELVEECGDIEVDELVYIGSCQIDDWRYRYSPDTIMSHLYAANMLSGDIRPGDDIVEALWYEMRQLKETDFTYEHRPLFEMIKPYWEEQIETFQQGDSTQQ
mgnify:CR=1 FL=1